jgi:hypothetical protein
VSDPPEPDVDSEDDAAIVLEAIEFMIGLEGLDPAARRNLEEVRERVERFSRS